MHSIGGIDPGKKGYAAMVVAGQLTSWRCPLIKKQSDVEEYDLEAMLKITMAMREAGVRAVGIERVQAFPVRKGAQGAMAGSSTTLLMGYGYGCWRTSLAAAGYTPARKNLFVVRATTWRSELGLQVESCKAGSVATEAEKRRDKEARKLLSLETARKDFPQIQKSDEAEAYLVAKWTNYALEAQDHEQLELV